MRGPYVPIGGIAVVDLEALKQEWVGVVFHASTSRSLEQQVLE